MKLPRPRRLALPLAAVVIGLSLPAFGDQLADMAQRLANLRGEVEELSRELASETTEGRDRLRSLARQKADLELELKKEQMRVAKLRRAIADKRKEVQESKQKDSEMAPLFENSLDEVRAYVESSLPFRTADRLSALDKLKEQYDSGLLSAPKAVSRLWSFVEDEFRLTRENGLYQQSVTVEGETQLADVVRIGMVMLYFEAGENTIGKAERKDGNWSFKRITDDDQKRQVRELLVSFKKQIRQGYFQVPEALPPVSGGAQ